MGIQAFRHQNTPVLSVLEICTDSSVLTFPIVIKPYPIEMQTAGEWEGRTERDKPLGRTHYLRRVTRETRDGGDKRYHSYRTGAKRARKIGSTVPDYVGLDPG